MTAPPATTDSATGNRKLFEEQLAAIALEAEQQQKWYRRYSLKRVCTVRNGYVFFGMLSFVLLATFGALGITVDEECLVQNVDGRCCSCLDLTEAQLAGQVMPRASNYNDTFYGICLIVNSVFGILYVYLAVKSENKFLLFIMVLTQAASCLRCVLDLVLEPGFESVSVRQQIRNALMYLAIVCMVISWLFIRPVYKLFGWKIFRKGGARRVIRQLYKMYQRYRAVNLLDIQSSTILFLASILYIGTARDTYGWVFAAFVICDALSSRYMVKYLKREVRAGVVLCLSVKVVVTAYWVALLSNSAMCYFSYAESRRRTAGWFAERAPDLMSVYHSYNGLSCIAPGTAFDDRTLELIAINLCQAIIFRLLTAVFSLLCMRNFGHGLKEVFYKKALERELQGRRGGDGDHSVPLREGEYFEGGDDMGSNGAAELSAATFGATTHKSGAAGGVSGSVHANPTSFHAFAPEPAAGRNEVETDEESTTGYYTPSGSAAHFYSAGESNLGDA